MFGLLLIAIAAMIPVPTPAQSTMSPTVYQTVRVKFNCPDPADHVRVWSGGMGAAGNTTGVRLTNGGTMDFGVTGLCEWGPRPWLLYSCSKNDDGVNAYWLTQTGSSTVSYPEASSKSLFNGKMRLDYDFISCP